VTSIAGAKSIAAGSTHTCVVAGDDNQVWCWGNNAQAQLGREPSTFGNPALVADGSLSGATDLAGGGFHSCAVVDDGEVRCWGLRTSGQVGTGSTSATPLQIPGAVVLDDFSTHLSGIADVSAGEAHTCARATSGAVYCWGRNSSGELGTGSSGSPNPVAEPVSGLSDVDMLAAGARHTCALVAGAVYCWGENIFRQLGQASGDSYATPTEIAGLTDAVSISTGGLHTCARRAGGSVVCWGNNDSGERGDATPATPSATRVTVSSLSASLLASGGIHNCALQDNGSAVCWGNNLYGQLGNGETSSTHLIQSISPL
jgi:alpha-tubulin suppressor-like RCC1 family protein